MSGGWRWCYGYGRTQRGTTGKQPKARRRKKILHGGGGCCEEEVAVPLAEQETVRGCSGGWSKELTEAFLVEGRRKNLHEQDPVQILGERL